MAAFKHLMDRSLGKPQFKKQFWKDRFSECKGLYRKDLYGHFGCVNAIEFSKDGQWFVSGKFDMD